MASSRELTPMQRNWMAALFLGFGLFVLAMAFGKVKTEPSSVHAPMWVLASAGMVFNLGGVMIFLVGREEVDALRNLVVWLFVLALAIPFNWIAFGAGSRQFSGSFSAGGLAVLGATAEWEGRLMFSFCSVLMDAVLIWAVVRMLRGKSAFDKPEKS